MKYRDSEGKKIPQSEYMRNRFPHLFPSIISDQYYMNPPIRLSYPDSDSVAAPKSGRKKFIQILFGVLIIVAIVLYANRHTVLTLLKK